MPPHNKLTFLDCLQVIPWGSLKYLIGDAMYGGRVSDSFDRRVLSTYLEEYSESAKSSHASLAHTLLLPLLLHPFR